MVNSRGDADATETITERGDGEGRHFWEERVASLEYAIGSLVLKERSTVRAGNVLAALSMARRRRRLVEEKLQVQLCLIANPLRTAAALLGDR